VVICLGIIVTVNTVSNFLLNLIYSENND